MSRILEWCASIVGPCQIVSGGQRLDDRSSTLRLQTPSGYCYIKFHQDRAFWDQEVHGYERWAPAFGACAPPLLAVHEDEPLALLIGELAGAILENVQLPVDQERAAWRTAGRMLAGLHAAAEQPAAAKQLAGVKQPAGAEGEFFGPCGRNGLPTGAPVRDAVEYVATALEQEIEKALCAGLLDDIELAVLRAAQCLTPAFAGERPFPCHRDYCPYNWLVNDRGEWAGVIDFEFAHWDVRVAEFSRYPDWEWMHRPDLVEAILDGYGRPLTAREEEQCLVTRAQYALSAITWGIETSYLGFVAEGRQALRYLAERLP